MDVVMDGLLIAGTLFAGAYCWVLAGRVRALKSLDSGLGGAIVTLTRQIELARATLDEARAGSRETRQDLSQLVARSDAAAAQLRLLLAAIEKSEAQAATLAHAAATPPDAARVQLQPPAQAVVQSPAPLQTALADARVARRREAPGPRLVPPPTPEAEPEAEPRPDASASIHGRDDGAAALPKPRRTLTLDGLLRRRAAPEAAPAPGTEAELIAALTALAAGGER